MLVFSIKLFCSKHGEGLLRMAAVLRPGEKALLSVSFLRPSPTPAVPIRGLLWFVCLLSLFFYIVSIHLELVLESNIFSSCISPTRKAPELPRGWVLVCVYALNRFLEKLEDYRI